MGIKFTIKGNVPALKNGKIIITHPFPRLVSKPAVQQWSNNAIKQLKELDLEKNIDFPVYLIANFWFVDKRRRDVDNSLSTLCDVLYKKKDYGISLLKDDSLIKKVIATNMGVDKENPRVEVEIGKYVGNK